MLEVGLGEMGYHARALAPGRGRGHQVVVPRGDLAAPLAAGAINNQRTQIRVPRQHAGIQQAEPRADIGRGDGQALVHRPDAVVQPDPRIPERVPQAVGDRGQLAVRAPLVDEQQVQVREREDLAAPQPAERDESEPAGLPDARLVRQQTELALIQRAQRPPQLRRGKVRVAPAQQIRASIPECLRSMTAECPAHRRLLPRVPRRPR